MKKKITILFMLTFSSLFAQIKPENIAVVRKVEYYTWYKDTTIWTTETVTHGAGSGAVGGAILGHLLFDMPVTGAIIGAAANTKIETYPVQKVIQIPFNGYKVTLNDGYWFKTFHQYSQYEVVDKSKLDIWK